MSRERANHASRLRRLARIQEAHNAGHRQIAIRARNASAEAEADGNAIVAALNADSPFYDITLSVMPAALQRRAAERDTAERAAETSAAAEAAGGERLRRILSRAKAQSDWAAKQSEFAALEAWLAAQRARRELK